MKNKIVEPFLIVFSCVFIFTFFSIIPPPKIVSINLKAKFDFLSDVRKKVIISPTIGPKNNSSKAFLKSSFLSDPSIIQDYCLDSNSSMKAFFSKLSLLNSNTKKIRIAYFGDSFIEADCVTDELRKLLQGKFGGSGIGFLPIQSTLSEEYQYIKFKSPQRWIDFNFRNNPYKFPLGLSGHIFYSDGNSFSEFKIHKDTQPNIIKLYTGKCKEDPSLIVYKDNRKEIVQINNIDSSINETVINKDPIKSFGLNCTNQTLPIYGVSIENNYGIYIDNYGFRGNTSVWNQQIPLRIMRGLNKYLKYDLIIVHYGLNALEHDRQEFPWFEASMNKLITSLKNGFINVPILLISTSDAGFKYDGEYKTEKAVPYMVEKQKKIAQNNNIAFFNLFNSMGGENTIVNWVEGDTVLAYKDYTHLNNRGSKKIAEIFYNCILNSQKKF